MGLTETQWRSLQVRSVDPYSSYFSDNVNKHTRIVSGGVDCIVSGLRGVINSSQHNLCNISTGVCIKDDVMLQFVSTVTIDATDTDFYADNTLPTESGVYYIVVNYQYQKVKPAPNAKIILCKPDQFDESYHLFLHAVTIDYYPTLGAYAFVNIYDYDPNNTAIQRIYPLFIGQLKGVPNGFASLDETAHIPPEQLWIDDSNISTRILWSSQKISNELQDLEARTLTNSLTSEYDTYQDWLQNSMFQCVVCDTFIDASMIDTDNTNATIDLDNGQITGSAGQQMQTLKLNSFANDITLDACAVSFEGSGDFDVYASADGGQTWEQLVINENGISDNHVFTNTGDDLRLRFVFHSDGVLYKYGVLFGIDSDTEVVNTIDASNMISWNPPATTLIAQSELELTRINIPAGRIIQIRRATLSRTDGPLTIDIKLQIYNETTQSIVKTITGEWWEGNIVIGPSQTISFKLINDSNETMTICTNITGIISNI